jgi:hypothetical protein
MKLHTDTAVGIGALLLAIVLVVFGAWLKERSCERAGREANARHEWTYDGGCRLEVRPGIWSKVARVHGMEEH